MVALIPATLLLIFLRRNDDAWLADTERTLTLCGVGLFVAWVLVRLALRRYRRQQQQAQSRYQPLSFRHDSIQRRLDTVILFLTVRETAAGTLLNRASSWADAAVKGDLTVAARALLDARAAWVAVACLDDDPVPTELAANRIELPLRAVQEALSTLSTRELPEADYRSADRGLVLVCLAGAANHKLPNIGRAPNSNGVAELLQTLAVEAEVLHGQCLVGGPFDEDTLPALPLPLVRI